MPRDGSGVASPPPGTSATPNTTILSTAYNVLRGDIYQLLNSTWPAPLLPDFLDGAFRVKNTADPTKVAALNLSGLTTAITRTLSVQDKDGTIAVTEDIASQSDMEAATSTTTFVSPGRQKYHPGHPKAWAVINQIGVQAIRASYNVSSITDTGVGRTQINFGTGFSSGNYAGVCSCPFNTAAFANESARSFSALEVTCRDTAYVGTDTDFLSIVCLGDQ